MADSALPLWRRPLAAGRRLSARTPLRIKLVAAVLLLVAVALTAAGAAAATTLRSYLLGRVDYQLKTNEGSIAAFTGNRFGDGRPPDPDGDHLGPASLYFVQIFDPAGNLVRNSGAQVDDGNAPQLPTLTANTAASLHGHLFTVPAREHGPSWRVLVEPLSRGPGGPGSFSDNGTVVIALSLGEVDHTTGRLIVLEGVIGLALLALIGAAGYVVVRRSLRPLGEVETTAAAIAAGDLSRRVPDRDARTEVGRLSAALNGMLAQIESAFHRQQSSERAARASEERMRQFIADASHELRTPLTSIRGFAELYRQGAVAEGEDVTRVMRRIEDEGARMGSLVDDLLLLARLDQQRPLEREQVDMAMVADDVVHDASAVAPDREISFVRTGTGDDAVVEGDESRLRQVVHNLVNNALVHTPPGAPVTVRIGTRGTGEAARVAVEVEDRGPGLTPEQAAHVFERFYRADASRTRAAGGSGLGLSIVAGIVAAHGGEVEVITAPGDGAMFRVLLPAAPASRGRARQSEEAIAPQPATAGSDAR